MPVRVFSQKVNTKFYEFCEFVTLTHPEFSRFYRKFYPDGKKRITADVLKDLKDPLSLAVWFMDDGGADWAGAVFHTQSFAKGEVDLLRKVLLDVFGIETTCRKNKNGWIIYVPKRKLNLFSNLIEEYLLPEFKYKLSPYSTRI